MRNFKKSIKAFALVFIYFFTSFTAFAQVDPCTDPAIYCPIDDYYPLLIGAVVLIAAVRAWKQNRKIIA